MKQITILFMAILTAVSSAVNTDFLIHLDKKCTVKDAEKASIDGTMPAGSRKITIRGDKSFSFRPFTGILYYSKHDYRGVAYTKLTFDKACQRTIGIGSGNFFTLFVNGKQIATTEPGGNFHRPIHPSNYIYNIDFKAGDNHVAIFTRPGTVGWELAFEIYPDFSGLPKDEKQRNRLIEQLFPPKNPGLLSKECLFNVSTDRAEFCFETGMPTIAAIRFRKAGSKTFSTVWNSRDAIRQETRIHRISLNGLLPATKYEYEVIFLNRQFARISVASKGTFTTFPVKNAATSFMLISDTQTDSSIRQHSIRKLLNMYGGKKTDFFVSLGDVSGNLNDFRREYFTAYYDVLPHNKYLKPAFFVRGNHEFRGQEISKYNQFFGKSYYAFRHGDVFFIVLEAGEDKNSFLRIPGHYTMTTDTEYYFEEQNKWLEKIIGSPECKTAKYRIVLAHAAPLYCLSGYFGKNLEKIVGKYFYGKNPRCRIDLWLAGHTHAPFHYDPASGKMYMADYSLSYDRKTNTNRQVPYKYRRPCKPTKEDTANIHFPVIVNDGPGGSGVYLSGMIVETNPDNIRVKIVPVVESYRSYMDKTVKPPIHDVTITPGKPAKINSTTLK